MITEGKSVPAGWRLVPPGALLEAGDMLCLTTWKTGYMWVKCDIGVGRANTNDCAVIRRDPFDGGDIGQL